MTSEGGTKSSFSPFLIFFKATSPLSPTSTLSMAIFWGGSPESDNHFCRADAFSKESTSQPHGMVSVTVIFLVLSLVGIEQWIGFLRKFTACNWEKWVFWSEWKLGMSVVCKIREASVMATLRLSESKKRRERPYLLKKGNTWLVLVFAVIKPSFKNLFFFTIGFLQNDIVYSLSWAHYKSWIKHLSMKMGLEYQKNKEKKKFFF